MLSHTGKYEIIHNITVKSIICYTVCFSINDEIWKNRVIQMYYELNEIFYIFFERMNKNVKVFYLL